jgi:hypothetical protein
MHAPTGSCLSRCRCDEAWESRPRLLGGMATSPKTIRSQTPPSRPSLGLDASRSERGFTTLTESTPAHFHAASQLLRRGRCAVARDGPGADLGDLPVRAGPEEGRLPTVGRAHHCCLGHRAPYPGLLRRPRQGRAMAAPLQPFAITRERHHAAAVGHLRLDRPAVQEPASQQARWQLDGPRGITHQG